MSRAFCSASSCLSCSSQMSCLALMSSSRVSLSSSRGSGRSSSSSSSKSRSSSAKWSCRSVDSCRWSRESIEAWSNIKAIALLWEAVSFFWWVDWIELRSNWCWSCCSLSGAVRFPRGVIWGGGCRDVSWTGASRCSLKFSASSIRRDTSWRFVCVYIDSLERGW